MTCEEHSKHLRRLWLTWTCDTVNNNYYFCHPLLYQGTDASTCDEATSGTPPLCANEGGPPGGGSLVVDENKGGDKKKGGGLFGGLFG